MAHRVLAAGAHALVAVGGLALAAGAARVVGASPTASVLVLAVTALVGSVGVPVWAAGLVAAATWAVHTGFLARPAAAGIGPEQVENLLLFAAAAGWGWTCGRRARVSGPVPPPSRPRPARPAPAAPRAPAPTAPAPPASPPPPRRAARSAAAR